MCPRVGDGPFQSFCTDSQTIGHISNKETSKLGKDASPLHAAKLTVNDFDFVTEGIFKVSVPRLLVSAGSLHVSSLESVQARIWTG